MKNCQITLPFSHFRMNARSRRFGPGLAVLALAASIFGGIPEASGSVRGELRKIGYTGRYSGVVTGMQYYRADGAVPFTRERVSSIKSISVPLKTREVLTDPKGKGKYRIFNKVSVSGARLRIRGTYFGERANENAVKTTVHRGFRLMTIRRIQPNWDVDKFRRNQIRPMIYVDRMEEFDKENVDVVLARWEVRGSLRRR